MDERLDAALSLHRSGRHGEAEPLYRAVLDADPDNRRALQLLALLSAQTGRPDAAAGLFARVAALEPESADAHSNLAGALRAAGRHAAAADHLRRALALDPLHVAAGFNLGNEMKRLDRAAEAERCYRRVLTAVPGHPAAAANLDVLRAARGTDLDRAAARRRAAARPGAGADAHAAAAEALDAVGDRAAAEAAARRALALDPGHRAASRRLGSLLLERSGLTAVSAGKPFAVDRVLAAEAVAALAAADPRDEEAERLRLLAVSTLVQIGLADDAMLHAAARAAWRRLARHRTDATAAVVAGFHVYRRGRAVLASRLMQRFLRRLTPAAIAADHELGIWAMLRADDGFFATLEPASAAVARMAPLEVQADPPATPGQPTVVLSCDDVYYRRFAPDLLDSLARRMPGAAVAVHVVDPGEATRRDLERRSADPRPGVGWSCERPDFTGWPDIKRFSYYAAARFIRAWQWQVRLGGPIIVLDLDCTVHSDLRALAGDMTGYDLGLLLDRRRRGPSREITVCFNWYADTPAGRLFLERVAAYIARFLLGPGTAYWLLDQTAHYAVLDWMNRHTPARVRWYDFPDFPHCSFIGAK
ncbi:tetratricopeptide repeat protein [Azospirillum halopraeferens]|uniref:tetratricopeptide repeat protein n=1 Tax=Azospirillum halopraeferens TaxID=34010 RepID=UPI000415D4E0|nr:tetratricopeptide repeat protein [Azospirillum halopraeferens]